MSAINNGGSAFPVADPFAVKCPKTTDEAMRLQSGMTLRDYFAAHRPAPADLSRAWGEAVVREFPKKDGCDAPFGREVAQWWADVEAAWSYMQADAMIKAREEQS